MAAVFTQAVSEAACADSEAAICSPAGAWRAEGPLPAGDLAGSEHMAATVGMAVKATVIPPTATKSAATTIGATQSRAAPTSAAIDA